MRWHCSVFLFSGRGITDICGSPDPTETKDLYFWRAVSTPLSPSTSVTLSLECEAGSRTES